jgi:hypothetical protein
MTDLMKRPTMADKFVMQRCLELCMPRVNQWLGADDGEPHATRDNLAKVLSAHGDGYTMARDLESLGWCSNTALVEVMNDCADDCSAALQELTAQWVRCYRITPDFAIGDRVALARAHGGHKEGIVVKIDADQAEYGIRVEGQKETAYWVVKFEHVSSPVMATPAAQLAEAIA